MKLCKVCLCLKIQNWSYSTFLQDICLKSLYIAYLFTFWPNYDLINKEWDSRWFQYKSELLYCEWTFISELSLFIFQDMFNEIFHQVLQVIWMDFTSISINNPSFEANKEKKSHVIYSLQINFHVHELNSIPYFESHLTFKQTDAYYLIEYFLQN